ncbi:MULTISPECIES: murein hydrolase activator NlpD [Lonsdalea]|uniref:Uncharacterized protein n=2 Tax=Lonsdalea TaxID=1082702 RepID=A0ACD1JGC8_9GAMM|nr:MULTISPECIES: murein hydrolase activator NlpD [Lonsdalea]OSN01557.1 hypothetical protein AU499_05520 [Lonsdalea populi]QPQ25785.1 murein hydrolase activator NlpD [Lonsdalea populi]RAT14735.1 hypothetical protein AU485_05230 [Lonsdalea quercina]RAT20561.1 hypothetical protein AU487_07635 [Lonsdalea populi]RAT21306.1 hypothetical protein AU488_12970 [Lonsdalea populi]
MGSQMMNWRQLAVCTAIALGLTGCADGNDQPASISSVGDGGNASSRSGAIASPPRLSSSANSRPVAAVSMPVTSAPVASQGGKIVYNRSYDAIPKGSYTGNTYTVKRGDTLFYIAWITGNDYRELAQRNNIPEPYSLNVGQSLALGNNMNASAGQGMAVASVPSGPVMTTSSSRSGHMLPANAAAGGVSQPQNSTQIQTSQVDSTSTNAYSANSGKQNVGKMLPATGAAASAPATEPTPVPSSSNAAITGWRWPTDGKVIDNFSASEGGNKGIDIAGSRGQTVVATAGGRVVYAGNALRGYGNLIIIKHNDDYLSAYAHNETMLVREQQEVKAGQQIATMGSTGTSSVRLHFEIRYKGKSVNPLRFIPQR